MFNSATEKKQQSKIQWNKAAEQNWSKNKVKTGQHRTVWTSYDETDCHVSDVSCTDILRHQPLFFTFHYSPVFSWPKLSFVPARCQDDTTWNFALDLPSHRGLHASQKTENRKKWVKLATDHYITGAHNRPILKTFILIILIARDLPAPHLQSASKSPSTYWVIIR